MRSALDCVSRRSSRTRLLPAIALSVLLGACASSPRVFTDFDPDQDFSDYRTFAWLTANPVTVVGDENISPLAQSRLMDATRSALQDKGFRFTQDRRNADFAVGMTVGARDKIDVQQVDVVDYYGPHWRWGYDYFGVASHPGGFTHTETLAHDYTEGSLSIDIYDTSSKSPVWHANASKRLSQKELRGEGKNNLQQGVARLLAAFPPTP